MSQPTPGAASSSPPTLLGPQQFLARKGFVELNARKRAQAFLDKGSYRELLGPFERLESPWLLLQGVVPQADDGLIVARGKIGGTDSVMLAIEGQFQGGGIGEVSGAKIAASLDLALEDAKKGHPVQVVLLLETGGVRLQEANLGLEAIAESTRRSSPCGSMFRSWASSPGRSAALVACRSPPRFAAI